MHVNAPGAVAGNKNTELELIEAIREADRLIAADTGEMDDHARGRRFRRVAEVAKRIATRAEAAEKHQAALDKLQTDRAKK